MRQVWSDLGFTIVFKSCKPFESGNDTIPKSSLIFGISKDIRSGSLGRVVNRRVPSILRDSPSAHPPVCYPWMLLAAIDINLHYYNPSMQAERKEDEISQSIDADLFSRQSQFLGFKLGSEVRDLEYPSNAGAAILVAEIYISDDEISIGSEQNDFDNDCDFMPISSSLSHSPIYPSLNRDQYYDPDLSPSLQIHCQLFDQGLRRLIMSPPSKVSPARVVQNNHLTNMMDLAPAVFMPQYRQVRLPNQIAELGVSS